ncbi:YopT-type cysteine protease domain-containing protein [Pseudomonas indica]|uniref:YopT-type cysteine protease domain-containing protein n=1 Tax=Pseudomonas indica TaxID=137658 RepID=UPI0023F8E749|nr:YopT-type cysteine protease domain-containing protein [Pseudomonas indica]MBU3059575.1 hypothetical protein [Pseudomonas indica]
MIGSVQNRGVVDIAAGPQQEAALSLTRSGQPAMRPPMAHRGLVELDRHLASPLPLPPPGRFEPRPVAHGPANHPLPSFLANAGGPGRTKGLPGDDALTEDFRDLAERNGCTVTTAFSQTTTRKAILGSIPGAAEMIPEKLQNKGLCYGLSLNWLKNAGEGRNDAHFFQALPAWSEDSLFLRCLGLEIEQDRMLPHGDEATFLHMLSFVGLHSATPERPFTELSWHSDRAFARQLNDRMMPGQEQFFVLLTDQHVMGLRKDASERLHFFDPNLGVVAADRAGALVQVIQETLEAAPEYWSEGNSQRPLSLCEVRPMANRRQTD